MWIVAEWPANDATMSLNAACTEVQGGVTFPRMRSSSVGCALLGLVLSLSGCGGGSDSGTASTSGGGGGEGGSGEAVAGSGGGGAGAGGATVDVKSCELLPAAIEEDLTVGPACVRVEETTVANNATLTIAAGTTVYMQSGAFLVVEGGGALSAVGTAAKPVVFTSAAAKPAAGDWQCVYLGTDSSGSELRYFEARYGGAPCGADGSGIEAAIVSDAAVRAIADGTISDSAGAGLMIPNFADGAPRDTDNLVFENNTAPSLVVGAAWIGTLGQGITFSPTADDYVQVETTFGDGGTLRALSVPWRLPEGFGLTLATSTLVVEAGATLLMEGGSFDAEIGTLSIEGTTADPVVIASAKSSPAAGDWGCLSVDSDDSLSNVIVRHGGSGAGCTGANYKTAIYTDGGTTFDAVKIEESSSAAVMAFNTCANAPVTEWCGTSSPFTFSEVSAPELRCGSGQAMCK